MPVAFVSKTEVAKWPLVGTAAPVSISRVPTTGDLLADDDVVVGPGGDLGEMRHDEHLVTPFAGQPGQ